MIYDMEQSALQHMADNNVAYRGNLVADGKVHRFSVDANQRKTDEWYAAHEGISSHGNNYLIVLYGSWSTGERFVFKSWSNQAAFTPTQRFEFEKIYLQKKDLIKQQLQEELEEGARQAFRIWLAAAQQPPTPEHLAYINAKGIKPYGIRYGLYANKLPMIIIPLQNTKGQIRSLQFIWINEDGKRERRFLPGAEKRGNFFTLGTITDGELIYVTEGYATGVSVYMATQTTTVIAFDAGNLKPVIENLTKSYPLSKIIIAGDDDEAGHEKARAASLLYGCSLRFPSFLNQPGTDFNDLHQLLGLETVKQQLTSSTTIETFKGAAPNQENTCKLLCHTMLQLTEKIMSPLTSETQRWFLGDVYEAKLKEYRNLKCTNSCNPES